MKTLLEFEYMRLEKKDKLAWITFTRERYLNAMNNEATVQLNRLAVALRDNPDVRVVVIRGRGRAFSTGIDLKQLAANEIDMSFHYRWEKALRVFETMEKIILVGMHGYCLGGGLQLALAAYNLGPEKVRMGRAIPAVRETRRYVTRVMNYYTGYKKE